MFNNTQNTYIAGGTFSITTNNPVNAPSPLDLLYKRAAPNAILNAGGRADEVRCHPGTREEVINRIENWRDAQDSRTPPIFWLSGPAGAGKTAIVQTIAERCKAQGVPQANFFFFRTDPSRNNLSPLVATLVHQIILLHPSLRESVAATIDNNPLILDSTLQDQLTQLIVKHLQTIRQLSSSHITPLLLIDGLDECMSEERRSQRQILQAFDKILTEDPCLFRVLVASRDESQIRAAFNNMSSQLLPLYLDEKYSPEDDIRVFVDDEFKRIRKTHPLAYTLDESWPFVQDVENIVKKSSGQFVYAATVMRFILDSSASPALSLARVHGATPVSTKSPFSYLDAIYTYILSQVDDQEALTDILHAQLFLQEFDALRHGTKVVDILAVYNPRYTEPIVHSCLADLTPIAQYTRHSELLFHHASFPDYLLDQSRSTNYFVDIDAFNFRIQPAVWKGYDKLERHTDQGLLMGVLALRGLIRLRQLPPGFLNTLTALEPLCFSSAVPASQAKDILKQLYDLCSCSDDVIHYKQILRRWINSQPVGYHLHNGYEPDDSRWPPCSRRYLAMAYIERTVTIAPLGWIDIALRPRTESDVRETASWLHDMLHRIRRKIYRDSVQEYKQLLRQWMAWVALNDIPLVGVDDLPAARSYLRRSRLEKQGASHLGFGSRPE